MLTEWDIREFLAYVANEKYRWGLTGNGAKTCQEKASHTTVYHYFVVLANFFGWVVREGFLPENPTTKIKVAKPKYKVIKPYNQQEISHMLAICDKDYENKAKFLGSRNQAIVLILLDSGVRLSELTRMKIEDLNIANGNIRVLGKGSKGYCAEWGFHRNTAMMILTQVLMINLYLNCFPHIDIGYQA